VAAVNENDLARVLPRTHAVATGGQRPELVAAPARRSTGVRIDVATGQATVRGHAVALTQQEFELLRVLVTGGGDVWTREMLLECAWRHDPYVTVRTIDAVIAALRGKIERDPREPAFIRSIGDSSYTFDGGD
jgi:DNA-binding response OmpR family regulator